MISKAGKYYERIKKVKPFDKQKRNKMYSSLEVKPFSKTKIYKDPIFDSIDRSARDSYLLRHSQQTVVNTNYYPKHSLVLSNSPSQKMSKGEFTRIIGDIHDLDFSTPFNPQSNYKCTRSISPLQLPLIKNKKITLNRNQKSLIYKDSQVYQKSSKNLIKSMKSMKSTQQSFLNKSQNQKSFDFLSLDLSSNSQVNSSRQYDNMRYHKRNTVKFQHYIGHRFLKQVFRDKQYAEDNFKNSQRKKVIKQSIQKPKPRYLLQTEKQQQNQIKTQTLQQQ